MSESMVERVAKAIQAKAPVGYGMTKDEARDYARTAIAAMRDPDDAMLEAMRTAPRPMVLIDSRIGEANMIHKTEWSAGIAAALRQVP